MTVAELAAPGTGRPSTHPARFLGAELPRLRQVGVLVALAVVYYVAGKLGLRLAFLHPSSTPVWPPTGIAIAASLILGRRVWPGVFAGAFLVNLTTVGGVATSLGIATGNTLEAWVAATLIYRWCGGPDCFDRARDVFTYTMLAAVCGPAISASVGVLSLTIGGLASWSSYGHVWLTWWLGDAAGALVVGPLLLLWSAQPGVRMTRKRALEAVTLFGGAMLISALVFGGLFEPGWGNYPLEFLCMPIFIWAAFRFDQRVSAVIIAVVNAVAIHSTLSGHGPFSLASANSSLIFLQAYTCVAAITTLTLAAVVSERRRVEERLLQMAVSDPLTGLGNYRFLMDALEREIQRSWRTGRPFSVLFFDLDKLKKINDKLGHIVGSRCLWRVGEVLRRTCRAVDTAARYGGDEFALILPESDAAAAEEVADRIRRLLRADREQPPITVSAGVAMYPRDGGSVAELLAAADRAQYAAKSGRPAG